MRRNRLHTGLVLCCEPVKAVQEYEDCQGPWIIIHIDLEYVHLVQKRIYLGVGTDIDFDLGSPSKMSCPRIFVVHPQVSGHRLHVGR